MRLFEEERKVLDLLVNEWYERIKDVTKVADGVFSEKAKMYDRSSPIWERIRWPFGYVQELRKKVDRISQLLDGIDPDDDESINKLDMKRWADVEEECIDIMNYSRYMAALTRMVLQRRRKQ